MKIIGYELYKLVKSKLTVILFAVLFTLNLASALSYDPVEGVPDECIRRIQREYLIADSQSKLEIARNTANEYIKNNAAELIFPDKTFEAELEKTKNYQDTMTRLRETAMQNAKPTVFMKAGSFEQQSNLNLAAAYENVSDNVPSYYPTYGTQLYINSEFTDILMLLLILTGAVVICGRDKMNGMAIVIRQTPKGRIYTAVGKLFSMLTLTVISGAALYGSQLLVGAVRFGLGDLSRCIQSIPQFILCNIDMTVGQYLIIHFLIKVAAFCAVAALLMMICTYFKSIILFFTSAAIIGGVSVALYLTIEDISAYNSFKYLNLVCLTQPQHLFSRYLDLNIFSKPINTQTACLAAIGVILAAAAVFYCMIFCTRRAAGKGQNNLIPKLQIKRKLTADLFINECYKVFISNKALAVFAALAVIQLYGFFNMTAEYDSDQKRYDSYVEQIGGEVTDETFTFLENEQLIFEQVNRERDELLSREPSDNEWGSYAEQLRQTENKLKYKDAFDKIYNHAEYIANSDKNLQIVFEEGLSRLLGVNGTDHDILMALIAMLALALCISPIYAADRQKGISKLLQTTVKGRGSLFADDSVIGVILSLLVYFAVWLPELIFVINNYRIEYLDAPVQSINGLENISGDTTILGYIILVYLLRLISAVVCGFAMLCVSRLSANLIAALSANMLLFVLPPSSSLAASGAAKVWISPYIAGTPARDADLANLAFTVAVILLICAGGMLGRKLLRS